MCEGGGGGVFAGHYGMLIEAHVDGIETTMFFVFRW